MGAAPLVVELLLVLLAAVFLLHRFGNFKRQHPVVLLSTLIGWYFSFIIVFVLPLDVSLAYYDACLNLRAAADRFETNRSGSNLSSHALPAAAVSDSSGNASLGLVSAAVWQMRCQPPLSYLPPGVLQRLWRVVYWSTLVLTWLVLPMMQSYTRAGEFSVLGKLRTAVRDNAIYYGSYLLIFSVLLIYVAAKGYYLDAGNLKVICITASNTWGLFLLVLLLGFGLVEIPRRMWKSGAKGYVLQKTYFEIEKLSAERNDAEETLKETFQEVQNASNRIKDSHELSGHAETIVNKYPSEFVHSQAQRLQQQQRFRDAEAANMPSLTDLVRLHKRTIEAIDAHNRTQALWNALLEKALYLEDVQRSESSGSRSLQHSFPHRRSAVTRLLCSPAVEWAWQCLLRRPLCRLLAVMAALLSVYIVWSEVSFFRRQPVLSLAAVFVQLAASHYNYAFIELCSMLSIAYVCVCAYYSVFKLRIFYFYYLVPHHHTDANSLLFSAILLSRLTPPICLNFLSMIHLDSHVATDMAGGAETSYTKIMGHMDVIGFISSGFNIYFPMMVLLLCLGTYFRLGSKLLHQLGFEQFLEDDEMTSELIQGGRALVQNERNRLQREWSRENKLGGSASAGGGVGSTQQQLSQRRAAAQQPGSGGEVWASGELGAAEGNPWSSEGWPSEQRAVLPARTAALRQTAAPQPRHSYGSQQPARNIFDDI